MIVRFVFRFQPIGTRGPQSILSGARATIRALGSAAFILAEGTQSSPGDLYLDRPIPGGGFAIRRLGQHAGHLSAKSPTDSFMYPAEAVRLGDRLAVPDTGVVRLYEEFGTIETTARTVCTNPQLALTRTTLYAHCGQAGASAALMAFPRRAPSQS
jgi:hypothetical protein